MEEKGFGAKMKDNRTKLVGFADVKIESAFLELKSGKFEEKQLTVFIERAMTDLKENPVVSYLIQHNDSAKIPPMTRHDLRFLPALREILLCRTYS